MVKETVYLNNNDKAFDEFKKIQKMQLEMDSHKKIVKEHSSKVRSLGQEIPKRIRRLKL